MNEKNLTRYAIDGTPKHYQTTDRPQVMGNWETDLCRFIGSEEDAVNVDHMAYE